MNVPHAHGGSGIRARLAVLTVSDTRTDADDDSGALLRRLLLDGGHEVVESKTLVC